MVQDINYEAVPLINAECDVSYIRQSQEDFDVMCG